MKKRDMARIGDLYREASQPGFPLGYRWAIYLIAPVVWLKVWLFVRKPDEDTSW